MMDNREIAAMLSTIAVYKELQGENVFKVRAFENAARAIEQLPEPVAELLGDGRLRTIKGIGESIAQVIAELATSNRSDELEALQKDIPGGLIEMLELQGLGPKKVRAIWQKLGITTIGELEYACKENRLISLEGFGEKTQAKILEAIEFKRSRSGFFLYSEALAIAAEIKEILGKTDYFSRIEIAGSLRRGKEIVKDADILLIFKADVDPAHIQNAVVRLADTKAGEKDEPDVIGQGETKVSIRRRGLQIDFRIIPEESFACALQYFTGSKAHNTIIRGRAKNLGFKVNEYEIAGAGKHNHPKTEEEFYKTLGLDWIPAELREGEDEIERALNHTLPKLVEPQNLKGLIHVHSNYSDGTLSIEDLIKECLSHGFSYLCLSDHSQSAGYAGGLSPERIVSQGTEIAALNKKYAAFRVFHGIESDIRSDGSLDYPDDVLSRFDFVIGAVHSKLKMEKSEATERLIRAIENPFLTILAHPSGRLLLSREGYSYDEEKVLAALAANNVVLEHNCHPSRLDPDWRTLQRAKARGIRISINPDLHGREGFEHVVIGCLIARKAGLGPDDIFNTMTIEEIHEYFEQRKKRASA